MKCIAGKHYDVIRYSEHRAARAGEIKELACKFCDFCVSKIGTQQPRSSKSGRGKYNRMRGIMVAHLHKYHRDRLEIEQ